MSKILSGIGVEIIKMLKIAFSWDFFDISHDVSPESTQFVGEYADFAESKVDEPGYVFYAAARAVEDYINMLVKAGVVDEMRRLYTYKAVKKC